MDEIIKVTFHSPLPESGEREFYFSSIAAIYERFSPAEVGCSLSTLWCFGLRVGNPKATKTCVISKHYIYRKPQTNPRK